MTRLKGASPVGQGLEHVSGMDIFGRPMGNAPGEAFGPRPLRVKRWQWRTILLGPVDSELGVPLTLRGILAGLAIGFVGAAALLGAIACLLLPA